MNDLGLSSNTTNYKIPSGAIIQVHKKQPCKTRKIERI